MTQVKRGSIEFTVVSHYKEGILTHITLRKSMKVSSGKIKTRSFHIQAQRIPEVIKLLQQSTTT